MLCIHIKNRDPYYCLAAEEYFLKNFDEDIFMLWQSENTVVVGKHQNLLAEINYPFVRENNIKLARRISGGGTVFHDAGNVNFTFIKNVKSPAEISFKIFTKPIVEALAKIGIEAITSGRNDLLINGLKISGNAEHVFKNRVLHHGTLLFNSDLEILGRSIKVVPGKYEGKAVPSNRSPVANILSFLKNNWSVNDFIKFLLEVQLENEGVDVYELNEKDIQNIQKLSEEKFTSWDWIWGYSPKYSFKNKITVESKIFSVELEVVKGIIQYGLIKGNLFAAAINKEISAELVNRRHDYNDIFELLISKTNNVTPELTDAFF